MLDLKIVNGTIIDGTGRLGYRGDVGVRDGRIVAIGEVAEAARETVDAAGRVVSPGFIDVHTHYDAQVFWEPTLSPSCYHGVTTIVGGFCGFSIAPLTPESAGYIKPMLARVEGMPLDVLDKGVPWNWRSFGDYLGKLDGKIGINAGFFAGHSAIRRIVMGERAVGGKATAQDIEAMKALLDQSLEEGALGFSTTTSLNHNDGDGNPVPSRAADHDEFVALAGVLRGHEGTGLEFLPARPFSEAMAAIMTDMSVAAGRAVNWNVLVVTGRPDAVETAERELAFTDYARERGGEIIALTVPVTPTAYLNLRSGYVMDSFPGLWGEIFKVPVEQRIDQFRDTAIRAQLAADAASVPKAILMSSLVDFDSFLVASVRSEKNKGCEGRRLGEIAAERGCTALEAMLDLAIDDGLETLFSPWLGGMDHETFALRGRIWQDDRTLIGASDAGAHLDMIDTFAFSSEVLALGVREHKVISLETAIHKMTQRPAEHYGLIDRGLIAEGYHADLVVLDPATVGRGPTYNRYDLPGGQDFRVYADAIGIDHVFVNGVEIVRHGEHSGKLPGTVLRSGRDTRTAPMDALQEKREREPAE
jgi:N-acyl-D-aspartate/D-glutamate deacylase